MPPYRSNSVRAGLRLFTSVMLAALVLHSASAAVPLTREAVLIETLHPYAGPTNHGVDASTLTGKIVCGYQGWFNAEGDGAERGWVHWTKRRGPLAPGNAKLDLWPDVSELTPEERFATNFRLAEDRVAEVFSAYKKPTVLRHFEWMRDYGIDGAFVQRFITDLGDPRALRHNNTVLANCSEGTNRSGRAYALMYDLSGLRAGHIGDVLDDFHSLRERMKLTKDPAYLRHHGQPLVAVWGVGFSDSRAYTLAECRQLVEARKKEGCTVMLGVPTSWRELTRDALPDPALHDLLKLADIVSPWTVGRFGDLAGVKRHAEKFLAPDLAWCHEQKLDYLPVIFPGFSWHNMTGGTLDQIPRQEGRFLWSQFSAAQRAGANMIYVAMFDEVDEETAIFKCSNDVPPPGESAFISYGVLPSDHYLRITGAAGKVLRGEIPPSATIPEGLTAPKKSAYQFDKTMSREVLENYLSRSISFTELLHDDLSKPHNSRGVDPRDNRRLILETKTKFVGRALMVWGRESNLSAFLETAKPYVEDGNLLFDFHSFPLRITEVTDQPHKGVSKVGYADSIFTKSKGGVTPSGWSCEHLPFVVEFDNFGRSNPGKAGKSPFIWGWDEITWFALMSEKERNDWLRYAWQWVKDTDPNGHLQMPGSRVITPGTPDGPRWYWANTRSEACPNGWNTEDTIKELWGTSRESKK